MKKQKTEILKLKVKEKLPSSMEARGASWYGRGRRRSAEIAIAAFVS